MARRGRPPKPPANPDGLDYGPVWRQIQAATRLGWSFRVEGSRVRMEAPAGLNERDAAKYAETWLGTMFAMSIIDRAEYEAGLQFQAATWRAYGRPFAAAHGGTHGGDPADRSGAQRFADRCKSVLSGRSIHTLHAVVDLCQYDRRPFARETRCVRDGLAVLADMIGLKRVA